MVYNTRSGKERLAKEGLTEQGEENVMKVLFYSRAMKAITMSVALAFSAMTFAAEIETAIPAACQKDKATKIAPTTAAKKTPSFLFVIDAKQGDITKDKKGQYHLVLKHAHIHHVIQFSDRPNSIVKYISGDQLKSLWKMGQNSFEQDPPNAVLSAFGLKTQIVILGGMEVTKETVSFAVSIGSDEAKVVSPLQPVSDLSHITLVIDTCGDNGISPEACEALYEGA